jgi:hypothetical protein
MKFKIASPFGSLEEIRNGVPHTGIDLQMPEGTILRSIADGVVEKVTHYHDNIGTGVVIRLDNGVRMIYGHMSKVSVKVGDHLDAGSMIGLSGNTGNSTGPHLHFGLWKDGQYIDPTPVVEVVDKLSGNADGGSLHLWEMKGIIAKLASKKIQEHAHQVSHDWIIGTLQSICDVLVEASYAIALVGTGILIILYVGGFKRGARWSGILLTAHVLIRYLYGGGGNS